MKPINYQMKKKGLVAFITASLLLHLLIFLLFSVWISRLDRTVQEPPPLWVDLKKIETQPKQIADIPKPRHEEKPEKAEASSLYDQKVNEEVVNVKPPQQSPSPQPPPVKGGGKMSHAIPSPSKIPGMPMESVSSAPDDFLPNYKWGNKTYINTLASPNIAYFVELKRKYRLTWNPAPLLRRHAYEISRGKISVVLGVSVNSRGELANLVVIRSSGFYDYDEEGKRTIRSSAPYTAPPKNLLGQDGQLHMAWTFTVYL